MKNIKQMIILLMVLTMVMITGCTSNLKKNEEKNFVIEDYNISFSFPEKWDKVTDTQFDLQCTNGNSYASIFVFDKIDLAEGQTPLDVYYAQNDDIMSKRENVKIVSEEKVNDVENKQIRSIMYSGENEGLKNYYYSNLIEFEENDDVFAWILFTAMPSYVESNIEMYDSITASANIVEEENNTQ